VAVVNTGSAFAGASSTGAAVVASRAARADGVRYR